MPRPLRPNEAPEAPGQVGTGLLHLLGPTGITQIVPPQPLGVPLGWDPTSASSGLRGGFSGRWLGQWKTSRQLWMVCEPP